MRTKIFYYVLFIVSVMTLGSCGDKSTEGLTRITYYPTIALNGSSTVIVEKGTAYKEPGYVSKLNGEDVSSQVTVDGTVNTAKSGVYTITYTTIKNVDGFSSSVSRKVIVINTKSPIEGFYNVSSDSYREYGGKIVAYGKSFEILVIDNGDGTYDVSDLLGGWYDKRAGYGSAYAMTGKIAIDGAGNITHVQSYIAGWGDGLVALSGTYTSATSSMSVMSQYVSNMKFYMTWTKKAL